MNHIMVVCDDEQEYAAKLVDYFNLKEGFPFDVRCFSDHKKFLEFAKKQEVELLLCSSKMGKELLYENGYKKIVLKEQNEECFKNWDSLWKYQSCEEMIRQLMEILSKSDIEYSHIVRRRKLKIIGFYSAVKRNLQTSFALTLGDHLGKREKCLYINMESNSGLRELLQINFKKDLSDIFYDMEVNNNTAEFYLASIVVKYKNLFILPDMENQNDLAAVSEKQWLTLLKKIEEETDFEYVLIDLSDAVRGIYDILQQCIRIYEIQSDVEISVYKTNQYHKQLKLSGYEEILKKIVECRIPYMGEIKISPNRMVNLEFDEYVKTFCKDEIYAIK